MYKFCVIGCQHMHIAVFIEQMLNLGHECAGIYDPLGSSLSEPLCSRFNVPRFTCLEEARDESIHIVSCSSVNRQKIDIVEWCEQHGKHIMLDKPAVIQREDYLRLKEVVLRSRIQVGMMLTERFQPSLRALKDMIEDGALGDLVHIAIRKPHRLSPRNRPSWFFEKDQHGGVIIDLMIHDFDLLHWLTNRRIVDSQGYATKRAPDYPSFVDTANLNVLLEQGITAQLYADWHTPDASWTWGDGRVFVTGTKGTAEVQLSGDPLLGVDRSVVRIVTDDTPLTTVKLPAVQETITQDFLNRLRGKQSVIAQTDILAASIATVEADEKVVVL